MIQTSPLVQAMAAALASTRRSASTSYPRVPINLSSRLPTALGLAEGPQKDFLLGQKARFHSCWTSPSYLPRSTAGGTARESHHRALLSLCLRRTMVLQGGDRSGHRGQETPTQTPKAGREAAARDQGQKKPRAAPNPKSAMEQNTQFPHSQLLCPLRAPSQGRCPMSCRSPTSSTEPLSPAWACRQELPHLVLYEKA